jgi:micrococcal nuclease
MAAFQAKVVGVADGDTISVLRDKTTYRIRLHGIDAPERGQPYGSRAKQYASELAFGTVVTVEPVDRDQYGRLVADVRLPDGRSLNAEMVRAGCAWWYRRYARDWLIRIPSRRGRRGSPAPVTR